MDSSESHTKRRHHRKSRLGCNQCKRRKIKCDETRPACLNCCRREVNCSYALSSAAAGGRPGARTCNCPCCHSGDATSAQSCDQSITVADSGLEPAPTENTAADLPRILAEQSAQLVSLSQQINSMERSMVKTSQRVSPQPTLTYTDMDLANHFYTSTLPTLAVGQESGHQAWTTCLNKFGDQYPHLYHLMLALAALHKGRLHCHQRAELLAQAEPHYAIGVQGSTALLGSIDDDNYEVVSTSATLIGLINLAKGPRPGEYITFSEQAGAGPSFIDLLRGLRSIRSHRHYNTTQEKLPTDAPSPGTISNGSEGSLFANNPNTHLGSLYARAREIPEARRRRSYIHALDDLEQFFIIMDGHPESSSASALPDAAHHLSPLGWIYRVQDDFLARLQNKESLALVIVAYFTVVLKELELGWPADGWAEHIMAKVCEELVDLDDRELIRWPMVRLKERRRGRVIGHATPLMQQAESGK